jgi:N-acetylglucosamine-6-phosphate deacetylase
MPEARIVVENGRIAAIGPEDGAFIEAGEAVDLAGGIVAPGFVDIHVHGGDGADFMDGTPEAVKTACRAHLRHGTTTLFPTTTTGSPDQIRAMLRACQSVAGESASAALPHIPGIHLYGPYFAPDKCGCHEKSGRRDPSAEEFESYFETGFVGIATCAAELPGAEAFYEAARRRNCFVTCGHSNASWAEMQSAFEAGMRHVDHFWCAMSSVPSLRSRLGTPMQASMEQYVLMNREMSTEVIADGVHLAPELLEFAARMIGPDRLCLVTDASRAMDCPPGKYKFGHFETGSDFINDGRVGLAPEGGLASSVQGMDHMVRTMAASTTLPLWDIVRMASLTPARLTGTDGEIGSIEAGKKADLVILSPELDVRSVILAGSVIDLGRRHFGIA